nr:reverse transcriptase domain-containing protein [Tanacetum cinerariifolium]
MAGLVKGGGPEDTNDQEENHPPLTKEQIEGHDHGIEKGKKVMNEELRKPFKEAQRTPLTHGIIEFAGPEYKMPTNIKLYDGITDPEDFLSRFASATNSGEWPMPVWCRMFQQTLDGSARGWGSHGKDAPQSAKIINVISVNSIKDKKQKVREVTEAWINTPITFPSIASKDTSDEPLIVKAEVEGYLVRWIYVDKGSQVEVMFEHCFENLHPRIKAKLKETRTDLVGFVGEVLKPLGKIELEVCFRNSGLCRRTSMKLIVVRAPSPYNIILGRPGLNTLRAISSTIHSMMKFPTPKGVATLVTRTVIIAECIRLEKKQMIYEGCFEGKKEVAVTEVLVNPSFPDQLVTIEGVLSKACREQLKCLLKDNMGVFAWEPSDMTGVPRRIIDHTWNVNPSLDPVCQKRRTFSLEKSGVVTNEVAKWVKAG